MAEEVASLGLKVSTDGIQEANDELNELAQVAPKVEKALEGAEKSAAKTGKTLASLGQGAGRDLQTVGTGAGNAQDGIDRLGKSADVAEKALKRMAATSGQIGDLSGDFKSVSDSMARLNQQLATTITGMGEFGESFKKTSKNANDSTTAITKFFAAATAGVSVWSVINMADDWGQMASRVKMATKSQEEYNLVMERTAASAKTTYRDVNEVRELFILSASSIQALGYSLDETLTLQESFSNLLVTNAASAERGASAIDALSSSLISGVVSGEDWKRITTAMPSLIDRMSDSTKKSAEQIKLLGKEGKIALQELTRTLLDTAEANETAAEAMPATVRDAIQKASNGLKDYLGYSNEATGATQVLVSSLNLLGDNMNVVATAVTAVAVIFGARLTSSLTLSTIEFTKTAAASVATSVGLIRAAAAGTTAATSFATLGTTMRAVNAALTPFGGAFGAILTVAGLATTAFYAFRDSSKDATQTLIDMSAPIEDVTAKLRDMSDAQRQVAENQLSASLSEGVDAADAAYKKLYEGLMNAAAASRMSSAEMQKLGDELDKARINGTSYLDVVNRLSSAKYVPDGTQEKLTGLAGAFDTAKDAINRAWLELEKFRGAAATTPTAGAADDAANLTKRLEAEAAAMAQGAAAYKSKAQATRDLIARQDEYRAKLKELEADNQGATKDANTLRDAIKGIGERLAGTTKNTNDAASAYKNWLSTIAEKTAAMRQELDGSNKLTESQKLLNKLTVELATGKVKLTAASVAKIKSDIQELAGMEKLRAETERSVKAYQEWIALQQEQVEESVRLSKAREELEQWTHKENEALKNSSRILQVQAANIGATDKQRQLALVTIQSQIQLEEELERIRNSDPMGGEDTREAQRIQAYQRHAERVAQAQTQVFITEWDKTSQLIGQTLSDYIMGGGKDAAQYLKRLFATLVLQPIVNYGVQGVMGMFTGGAGNAATAAAGGGMGINPFSALNGLNSLGLLGNFGAGMSAGAAGWAGTLGFAGTGTTVGGSMSAGIIALQNGNIMGGLGTLAGVIGPVVAGLGVLASVLGAFDKPTPHQGAVGYYTTQGGSENYQAGQTQYNAEIGGILETLSSSVGASFEAFLTSFGLDNNVAVTTNWADDFNGKGESWGYFALAMQDAFGEWTNLVDWRANGGPEVREYAEGEAGFEEYALDVYRSFVDGLKQVDIPAWATGVLDQIGDDASLDQINAVLAQLGVMKDTLASWNTYLVEFANVGDEAFGALLESMGGFENLSTGVASFVDLFYSDAEKLEMSQKQIAEQLAKFDLKMPMLDMSDETMDTAEEVKAAWRSMVEEALAAGEEGADLAAMLLNLGPAFASATDAAESAAQAEAELAQAREDARQAQLDEWMSLGGLSVQSMSQGVMDALQNGEDPGAWLADHITGGFEQAMQMQALNMVMQRIMDEALAPAMEEIMTDLFGEKSDSTATTAEEAVLKVFDAMDAAFAAVTGESVLNLGAGQVSTGQVDGMQEISNDGLASLDTTMPVDGEYAALFDSVQVQLKPALEAFVNDLGLAGVEAVDGVDLTATSEAINQLLGGLVSEESIAGLAEMLANLPEMDPEQAAAIAAMTQESLESLLGGIADGSLGLLDASVFANAAFGGMADAITAGSSDMLNATATASVVSTSAVVGHANSSIKTIDEAVSFANGKINELLSSELGQQLFGGIKAPSSNVLQPFRSVRGDYSSMFKTQANDMISAWKSVYDAIYGSMTNLRDAILGTTEDEGNSFYEAQFAMLTAQARAGDQDAAEKLPEIVAKLSEYAQSNSASLFDQNSSIAGYIKSLEDTQAYIAAFYKKAGGSLSDLEAWGAQSVHQAVSVAPVTVSAKVIPAVDNSAMLNSLNSSGNTALLAEFRAMRTELAAVKAELAAVRSNTEDSAANTRDISRTLNEVTNGGDAMITREETA